MSSLVGGHFGCRGRGCVLCAAAEGLKQRRVRHGCTDTAEQGREIQRSENSAQRARIFKLRDLRPRDTSPSAGPGELEPIKTSKLEVNDEIRRVLACVYLVEQ